MKNNQKSGFSLVEVVISILLLVVLILGGAAVMHQTGGTIQRQQNKREALIAANEVMETYWNQSFQDLSDLAGSTRSANKTVNGIPMSGTITFSDVIQDSDGNEYIEIKVNIVHQGTTDDVEIITRRYPNGLSRAELEDET